MENEFFEELKEKVKKIVGEKGSHDIDHIERVYNYAILISKNLDVDLDIVKASALLHDIAKHKEKKGKVKDHAAQGSIEAKKILKKMKFPKEKIEIVCKCILMHNKKEDLDNIKEVRVLKEADALEAVGAIAIARSFSYNGEQNNWNPSNSGSPLKELIRNLNVDYFRLPIAREIAKRKVDTTKIFCDEFIREQEIKN